MTAGDDGTPGSTGRAAACPDEITLARAAAGDLPAARMLDVERHLDGCARCRERWASVDGEASFLASFGADLASHQRIDDGDDRADGPDEDVALRGYRTLEEVERGGQGVVHRAIHEATGRVVAIKTLHDGSSRAALRFQREGRLAARLRHPNIVAIHDCGELAPGRVALVMEWVEGEPLDEWAERVRSDPARTPVERRDAILRVGIAFCAAVEHAHRNGVLHRDLKPANVLVDTDGEPRVLDFGVASDLENGRVHRVTMTGEIACTLQYAAPEQLTGDPDAADTRADVHAIGATLHHALVGVAPHDGPGGVAELVERITDPTGRVPSPIGRGDGAVRIDRDLATVLQHALAHDRERRYGSAAALGADLRHVLEGAPLDVRRDSLASLARTAFRRHRRALTVGAIVFVALAIGGTALLVAEAGRRDAARRETAERARMLDEARRSAAVSTLLRGVLPAGNTSPGWSGTDEASRALDAISRTLDTGPLADDPDGVVATRRAIADVAFARGALRRAEVEYRQALRIARDARGEDDVVTATVAVRLARLLARRSSVDEAHALLDDAQPVLLAQLGASHPEHLEAVATRAEMAVDGGRLDEARATLDRLAGLRLVDDHEAAMRETDLRRRLALAAGDAPAAARAAREHLRRTLLARPDGDDALAPALRTAAALLETADPALAARARAIGVHDEGIVLSELDPDALAALLDVKATLLGPDHADLVETLVLRGHRLADAGRFTEAAASADRAFELLAPDGAIRTIGQLDVAHEAVRWRGAIAVPAPIEPARIERVRDAVRALLVGRSPLHSVTRLRELARFAACAHLDDLADELVDEALALARAQWPDGAHLAWALVECGSVKIIHGDPDRGLPLVEDGRRRLEDADDSWSWHRAVASARCGQLHALAGRPEPALAALDEADRLMRASDTPLAQQPVLLRWIEEIAADVRAGRPIDRLR